MKKCVKIIFEVQDAQKVLESFVVQKATQCKVEGVAQQVKPGMVQMYTCGPEESVDDFIDHLYFGDKKVKISNIKIEMSSTDRSYRGVFRIVD